VNEQRKEITPVGPIRGRIQPPGSKSITNRALICAALARGISTLRGALASEDTQVMIESLRTLEIPLEVREDGREIVVTGCSGQPPRRSAELYVANSGTTIRFLTAMLAACGGQYRLDGIPRMRQRPIEDLLEALRQLGADAKSETGSGCPPVQIDSSGWQGGRATVRGDISSQFLSALLMAAPLARETVRIDVDGPLVSQPYVTMTQRVMESFGVEVHETRDAEGALSYEIPAPKSYRGTDYVIEPDASAASYFWAAAAITGGDVTVSHLSLDALQGDVGFCRYLEQMGCTLEASPDGLRIRGGTLRGIEVDMNSISDTVQTLAVVALFAEGPTTIRGVAHIRHKETDRIGDLARELRRLGARVEEFEDGLRIEPAKLEGAEIETYNDHRMAMSFALAGLRIPGVVILNPRCVEKTYPQFFEDLEQLVRQS